MDHTASTTANTVQPSFQILTHISHNLPHQAL
jgi:hypothetical protein